MFRVSSLLKTLEVIFMEKMNQVSVSEFMNLTKEEMYDNAVKMVEKYNRLVDICNDSAERIATLVKENERRITYADELNKDIAKKVVKIKLLEQEIEGRKEGYYALKDKYEKLEKEFEAYKEEHEGVNSKIKLTEAEKKYCMHGVQFIAPRGCGKTMGMMKFIYDQAMANGNMPKKVYFNPPYTTALFFDGERTTCKCSKMDNWNPEAAVAICICKRIFGDGCKRMFKYFITEAQEKADRKIEKSERKAKKKELLVNSKDSKKTGKKASGVKKEDSKMFDMTD